MSWFYATCYVFFVATCHMEYIQRRCVGAKFSSKVCALAIGVTLRYLNEYKVGGRKKMLVCVVLALYYIASGKGLEQLEEVGDHVVEDMV